MHWHQKSIDRVLTELNSSPAGLSSPEAEERLATYGPNALREVKGKTPFMIFLDQFRDFMIMVLIAAAVVSGVIGELTDTAVIVAIVILNAVIGFIQEYRAERAMDALRRMAAPSATVLRSGVPSLIPADRLVPGDVVLIEAGSIVPADIRIMEAFRLKIEEAALTGESVPVEKVVEPIPEENLTLGDRKNMCYKGTVSTYGRGQGVVVATGMETELGKIATMLQEEEEVKTPLQRRLTTFGRRLSLAILVVCALIFVAGIGRGENPLQMFLTVVALAVAAIPEALPAVVTIALALGARKMVRQNALIRKLPAVETLGSVTFICSDKTGTLTLNKMTAEEIWPDFPGGAGPSLIPDGHLSLAPSTLFLIAAALSNDAHMGASGEVIGDPTEGALYNLAKNRGFHKKALEKRFPRIAELPFDSERKCMTTFHRLDGGVISFTKGAVEALLDRSTAGPSAGAEVLVAQEVLTTGERMAGEGLRVLCIAMRRWESLPEPLTSEEAETGLTILGLVGMMDPPRREAFDAVALCKTAGIRPVMITGDHPVTAQVIARRLAILEDDGERVITGRELEGLSLEEFEQRVEHIRVYARVAPAQKLKIVKALQERGHFVAMTGDGVNDAPALKRADIGVAMGVTGTDVAKEAAHLILLDDNFATIVKAVREGRRIYDNIRKFVKYLITTNAGEIIAISCAPFLGLPIPLLPVQILWVNLMTDALPALALSLEPTEGDVMARPPRHPRESIFAHGLGLHAVWVGFLIGALVLGAQAWSLRQGDVHWQTMTFTVLCFTQLFHVLAIRSERESLFTIGLFSNKALLGAVLISFVLQLAIVYVPFLNPVFKTKPLEWWELLATIALSAVVFVAVEMEKLAKRRFSAGGPSFDARGGM